MTKSERQAQAYRVVRHPSGERKIVNIKRLLKGHPLGEIIQFLSGLYKEQEKELQALVEKDKTSHKVDAVVSRMFRLRMAIALLKRPETEVNENDQERRVPI